MTLQWYRADDYHYRSSCGRFSVCRIAAGLVLWYEAHRWPGGMLGATRVPITASKEERVKAFDAMKDVCEAEASSKPLANGEQTPSEPPSESLQCRPL